MNKKIIIIPIAVTIVAIGILSLPNAEETEFDIVPAEIFEADIIMPNKSSRPGCEQDDMCYIPPEFVIKQGDSVTWHNQDVAFHSVTSGLYEERTNLFDSGHMDPDEQFSMTFDEQGTYDYFCSLHPWMKGKIIVE